MTLPARAPLPSVVALIRHALEEDRYRRDVTTKGLLAGHVRARGTVSAQAPGVVSGLAAVSAAVRALGVRTTQRVKDGARVRRGETVLVLAGAARHLLAVERTVLNVLMHASGVATDTARAVRAVRGSRPPLEIWSTRKTLPGLRDLETAAVVDGGGKPHRRDLSDAVLVKTNHLALVPLAEAVRRLRRRYGARRPIEVEVRTEAEALRAARVGVRRILIDNAGPARSRSILRALERAGLRASLWVELSGGITPENAGRYRAVGADALSLGSLTHSAPALPFHLTIAPSPLRRPPN